MYQVGASPLHTDDQAETVTPSKPFKRASKWNLLSELFNRPGNHLLGEVSTNLLSSRLKMKL